MALKETIKVKHNVWTEITDTNCLIQFKLDLGSTLYWYEGNEPPNMSSPDYRETVGVLNDGRGQTMGFIDKKYTNTIGKLWVYAQRDMYVTILEEVD